MGLIRCADCDHDVSDSAPACPQCGRPIAAQVIERTAKTWKAVQLFGGLAILFSLPLLLTDYRNAFIVMVPGLFALLLGRTAAWWHHG